MMPAPTATMLRDEDGVVWKPSPIVAVALMIFVPLPDGASVWSFARWHACNA